ncbi:phosphatase PAP2 family protein [Sphingomonas sp. 28-63-12]|uniref:phosphatase PAP2 family protein n=1 Tax=Sphingomonas sp. 28-63-12 TaxID=1970434 RepID=UPI0035A8C077
MPESAPLPEDIRHPPWLYYAAGALALAVLTIVLLGATIARGHQFAFDRAIMLAMREPENMRVPEGPVWLKQVMLDVTALGGETVLTLIVIVTAGFLALRRHWLTFWLVLAGTISGSWAVGLVKTIVGRPRPALIDHLVEVWSASFPSGHAANSAIIYLTVTLLLMQIVESRAARWYMIAVAMLLVTAIGVSRVYLGVHWPSDVLAGWSFGTLWALGWWSFGSWLRLRRLALTPVPGVPALP